MIIRTCLKLSMGLSYIQQQNLALRKNLTPSEKAFFIA